MSPFKLICVAAAVAASLGATSAFAGCTQDQEVALAQGTTRVLADRGGTQHKKKVTLHDCDTSDDGSVNAGFTYNYFDEQGLQTVKGTARTSRGRTSVDADKDRKVASRSDRDEFEDVYLGTYTYR